MAGKATDDAAVRPGRCETCRFWVRMDEGALIDRFDHLTDDAGAVFVGECRPDGRILELDLAGGEPRVLLEGVPMANAMDVGPDGSIQVEDGDGVETTWEYLEGVRWNEGYLSPHFVRAGETSIRVLNPRVFLTTYHLERAEQIVQRDENSWLVDGVTPISDVMRAFDIEEFPENQNYETIAGFIMYMLRKIPKRTSI